MARAHDMATARLPGGQVQLTLSGGFLHIAPFAHRTPYRFRGHDYFVHLSRAVWYDPDSKRISLGDWKIHNQRPGIRNFASNRQPARQRQEDILREVGEALEALCRPEGPLYPFLRHGLLQHYQWQRERLAERLEETRIHLEELAQDLVDMDALVEGLRVAGPVPAAAR